MLSLLKDITSNIIMLKMFGGNMAKKTVPVECECKGYCQKGGGNTPDAVYGIGLIGTAFYFLQHASNFTDVVMAIVQAVFWPAILVYHALQLLNL
jgi:hypothetical protein